MAYIVYDHNHQVNTLTAIVPITQSSSSGQQASSIQSANAQSNVQSQPSVSSVAGSQSSVLAQAPIVQQPQTTPQTTSEQSNPTPTQNPTPTPTPTPVPTPVPTPTPTPTPTPQPQQGQYKNGQYTGSSADALYGTVQVAITVSGGQLSAIQFLSYPNDRTTSQALSNMAMPKLIQEAISSQSANVNAVSGATETSQAFVQSLSSALSQAKA